MVNSREVGFEGGGTGEVKDRARTLTDALAVTGGLAQYIEHTR